MPTLQYSDNPNSETAFAVQDSGQKNRVVLTAAQDTSTLELPDNPNSTKGYVTVGGKKHRVILTAEMTGGGQGGGAVQIAVSGTATVEGYTVPNPTAEEITAIYNSLVAGKNVQIVDSNDVYYQVLQADSVDGAINIEALYFGELALLYTLENNTVTITGKKIGGGGLPEQTGNAGKFLTTDGETASWSNKPLINSSTGTNSIQIMASGNAPSTAVGIGIGVTVGERSVRIGSGSGNATNDSIAIGNYASANQYSIGIGNGYSATSRTQADYYGIAIGNNAKATNYNIAIGGYIQPGAYGIAIGATPKGYKGGAHSILMVAGENSWNVTGASPTGSIILDAIDGKNSSTPYSGCSQDCFYVGLGKTLWKVLDGTTGLFSPNRIGTGYDATKTQVLKNVQGVLTWVDE